MIITKREGDLSKFNNPIAEKTDIYCPLCRYTKGSSYFYSDIYRDYYRCSQCNLIHVPHSQHLSPEEELREYDKHQNSPTDKGYRKFLSRLFIPLNNRICPGSHGLDFGSGPGPTLSVMFREAGHHMSLYDPFYSPDTDVFNGKYDFITASEVVEHLHNPAIELELLWSILKQGGWLGIMTKLALGKAAFSKWHYKNDLTHVCFFSKDTMDWLAVRFKADILCYGKDVVLIKKSS